MARYIVGTCWPWCSMPLLRRRWSVRWWTCRRCGSEYRWDRTRRVWTGPRHYDAMWPKAHRKRPDDATPVAPHEARDRTRA